MGAFDKVRTINAVRVSHIYFNPGVRTELPLSLSPPPSLFSFARYETIKHDPDAPDTPGQITSSTS